MIYVIDNIESFASGLVFSSTIASDEKTLHAGLMDTNPFSLVSAKINGKTDSENK